MDFSASWLDGPVIVQKVTVPVLDERARRVTTSPGAETRMTSGAHTLCLLGPGACGGGQGPLSERLLVGFSGQRPAIPPCTLHRPGRPREEGLSAQISGGACAEKAPCCPGAPPAVGTTAVHVRLARVPGAGSQDPSEQARCRRRRP